MTTETSPILNLLLAKGIGVKTLARIVDDLIASHLSPEESSISDLATHLHWSDGFIEKTESVQEHADNLAEELEKADIKILVRGFSPYPDKLIRTLGQDAPPVLFAKGNLEILDRKAVGFCGSRHASDKGVRVASDSAHQLGKKQIDVVSGYAKGVDLAAHCAALESGGTTTIVLAEGILHFRPKREIKKLLIPENHLVISEYSPRIPWAARNAMQRNETIIGLSDAMIVIESGTSGGTHACAESALRLGHPLFVAEYSSPAESAEGNRVFLDKGAQALRGDRRGQPNLSHVYESLGIVPRGSDAAETQPPVAEEANPNGDRPPPNSEAAAKSHEEPVQVNRYPKRLIEVDLPIARISAHARREKSIRHGHISTLHIWWARRPLAACRAVICAALWPDPADELCPPAFRQAACEQITVFAKRVFPDRINEEGHQLKSTASQESLGRWEAIAAGTLTLDPLEPADGFMLRQCLLDFIADFANWDNSTVPAYLETSRTLTQTAHEALGGVPGTRPLVVDPFAGGGSIPLEALRVGADAFASDLNPVAVLLNKVVLEYIPKYGQRLADEVRKWGQWVKEEAEKELAEFYPKDPDGATPIAYLWARTVNCEGPGCGAELPLIRTLQTSRKGDGWQFRIEESKNTVAFRMQRGNGPTSSATVANGSANCPRKVCGFTTPAKRVREQLIMQHGGGRDARLLAVCVDDGTRRVFRDPTDRDLEAVSQATRSVDRDALPTDEINPARPYKNTRGLSAVTRIGIRQFRDLYNDRQALSLLAFQGIVREVADPMWDEAFRLAVATCLNCVASRLVFQNCTLSRWNASRDTIEGAFGKQALQNTWDFAESNPISSGPACWEGGLEWVLKVLEANLCLSGEATVIRARAQDQVLPDEAAHALITDPPYFAAIPYSDLSDVFYVWERHFIKEFYPDLYIDGLTDKSAEAIVTNANVGSDGKPKTPDFYQRQMKLALESERKSTRHDGIGIVVFADSSTESWEAILGAVIAAGWQITASWPIDTELQSRTQAAGSASLQSSIHVVCRPRENKDGTLREEVGEWRDVLSELPPRIHEWMPRLAAEGVVGADAIFACLGPALEIFSRYSRVEKASGEAVLLREYLEQVWATVSTEALSMIFKDADAAGLEPDARLTAMWLWTLGGGTGKAGANGNTNDAVPGMASEDDEDDEEQSSGKSTASGGFTLEFDAARKIAQGLGVHLEQSDSIVEVKGDKARLLPVGERVRHLFGKDETATTTQGKKKKSKAKQRSLFEEVDALEAEAEETVAGELKPHAGETVLDRVHQSMILFAAGRGEALRRFLVDDGIGKDARFWKLAQSLSALYPTGTEEKRWVDGVLARKKGLGL